MMKGEGGSKFTEGNHCLCAANGSRALSRGNAEHDFAMDTRANPLCHPRTYSKRTLDPADLHRWMFDFSSCTREGERGSKHRGALNITDSI